MNVLCGMIRVCTTLTPTTSTQIATARAAGQSKKSLDDRLTFVSVHIRGE